MTDRPSPYSVERLVWRLTGPVGPELNCDECFQALDLYVELELVGDAADATVPGMHAHLEGCPACRADHDSMLALLRHDPDSDI
jgi:hypothetical protein